MGVLEMVKSRFRVVVQFNAYVFLLEECASSALPQFYELIVVDNAFPKTSSVPRTCLQA